MERLLSLCIFVNIMYIYKYVSVYQVWLGPFWLLHAGLVSSSDLIMVFWALVYLEMSNQYGLVLQKKVF